MHYEIKHSRQTLTVMLLSYPITGSAKSSSLTLLNAQQLVAAGASGGHDGCNSRGRARTPLILRLGALRGMSSKLPVRDAVARVSSSKDQC